MAGRLSRLTTVLTYSASSVVRAGLESLTEASPNLLVVGAAASLAELRARMRELHPDAVVADVPAASDDAIHDVLGEARAAVILTDAADGPWVETALILGSRAVLDRDAGPGEIMAAISAVTSGLVVLQTRQAATLTSSLPGLRRAHALTESLTPREVEVLGMLAEGLGNKTIAYRLGISEHTVKFHVGSILRKLDVSSRTEAVTSGVRQGFITV